jgi:hypothetical protein
VAAQVAVYDPLKSVDALTDPGAVDVIAKQLNDVAQNQNRAGGAPTIRDLSDALADVMLEWSAQGASTLTLQVIDPYWGLVTRFGSKPAFIDVDDAGLLVPVDVNFPEGTDAWWRLMACEVGIDTTVANLKLVFEDRICVDLRDLGGPKYASNNQDRAQFIESCVDPVRDIRFVCPALNLPAGSVGGNVTQGTIDKSQNVALSALNPKAPAARRNPSKKRGISTGGRNRLTPGGKIVGPTGPVGSTTPGAVGSPVLGPPAPSSVSILNPPSSPSVGVGGKQGFAP